MFPFQVIKHYSKQRFKGPTLMSGVVINNIHLHANILRLLSQQASPGGLNVPADSWFAPFICFASHFFTEGKGTLSRGDSRHGEVPSCSSSACPPTLPLGGREEPMSPRLTTGQLSGVVRKYNGPSH